MATIGLDEFVFRLQTAAGLAQDALVADGQRRRVQRDLILNNRSEIETETWCLKVDLTPAGQGTPRIVSIPFMSLHTLHETRVTELLIETTAIVEEMPPATPEEPPEIQLRIGTDRPKRSALHKLVVRVFGVRFEKAEVRLNDRLFRAFGFDPEKDRDRP